MLEIFIFPAPRLRLGPWRTGGSRKRKRKHGRSASMIHCFDESCRTLVLVQSQTRLRSCRSWDFLGELGRNPDVTVCKVWIKNAPIDQRDLMIIDSKWLIMIRSLLNILSMWLLRHWPGFSLPVTLTNRTKLQNWCSHYRSFLLFHILCFEWLNVKLLTDTICWRL